MPHAGTMSLGTTELLRQWGMSPLPGCFSPWALQSSCSACGSGAWSHGAMRASSPTAGILRSPWRWVLGGWVLRRCHRPQGSGRYSIYIANYASGNVGPHALIEMDVAASDPARGIVVLVDVAAQAGVSKYTGTQLLWPCGRDGALPGTANVGPHRRQGGAVGGLCHVLGCLTAPSSGSPTARGRDQGHGMPTWQDPRAHHHLG